MMLPAEYAEWRALGFVSACVVLSGAPSRWRMVCPSCEVDTLEPDFTLADWRADAHNKTIRHTIGRRL